MKSLTINLPEDANLKDVKMLIAAALFKQGILSSGQAAEMAGVTRRAFLEDVGKYGVSVFGETEEDLKISGFQKLSNWKCLRKQGSLAFDKKQTDRRIGDERTGELLTGRISFSSACCRYNHLQF